MNGLNGILSMYRLPKIPSSGLMCYLDASLYHSWPRTGSTWYDISGNNRNFVWSSVSFTDNGQLSYFNTSTRTATGPASNALGLSGANDYTIISINYVNTITENNAIRIWQNGASDGDQRAFGTHLPWSNNIIYWDQGGCCGTDTRTSVDVSGTTGAYRMWTYRRGSDGRKIFRGPTLLTTNTASAASMSPNSTAAVINYRVGAINWDARINAFMIYNRAISDTELSSIYNYFGTRGLTN